MAGPIRKFRMHRSTRIVLVLGVLGLAADMPVSHAAEKTAPGAAARCVARPEVLVIAHRGDSKVAPENTLPAFASAVKAGADLVELDYYHSADGIPVVFHDAELDRATNAVRLWGGEKIKLNSKSLAELKLLDAGSWFGPKFSGTRIPTLDEALDTIQAGSLTLIERKGGEPATCIELLKQKKLLDQVVVQAFDWDYLTGCHQIAPDLVLAALSDKECTPEKLDQIAKTGARIVGWEDKFTNDQSIAAIHARGWKAWVWTVDDPKRIDQLVKAKVDGIITNRPALARQTINATTGSR
jgi:glycerophosphoryl diester phosphodiesterase